MNLSGEDKRLLDELCGQNGVSRDKVLRLLPGTAAVQTTESSLNH